MRQLIVRMGRIRSMIATTAIALLLSNLFTILLVSIFSWMGAQLHFWAALVIDSLVCIIVTPIVSWSFFGLILEINRLELEMRRLATIDSLTGLLTRRAFMEEAGYILRVAEREALTFTLMIVDFDDFKSINDTFGHAIGDKVLAAFGKIVNRITRKSDLACRMGGEEFLFLLPHTSIDQAKIFANRLQTAIREFSVMDEQGMNVPYTVSIGLVDYPQPGENSLDTLLILADKALYIAKANGRDQTVAYKQS